MKNVTQGNLETAVEVAGKGEVVRHSQPLDIEAMFKYAIDKGANLDSLMNVRREINAEASKKAFDSALAKFQAECPVILKRKSGAKNAYKFAPLDDIMPIVQPLLSKHGFSFSITSEVESKWIKAICKITHSGGHFDSGEFKVPTDERNVMMNDPQKYAGSLTFAKRYAFCNAFGIMTGDEDRDAAGAQQASTSARVATPELRNRFFEVTKPLHQKILAWAIDLGKIMPNGTLDDFPDSEIPTTKTELEKFKVKIEAHQ